MITRIWHGRTSPENADNYLQFLLTDGTKEYWQTKGIISVRVLQRKEEDSCRFWTVTEWIDIESIKLFAGENYEKAKYYPEDNGKLLEFEEKVIHCQTFVIQTPDVEGNVPAK